MEKLKNWFIDVASVMFDDSKGDFRALPKTVRLQILCTLFNIPHFQNLSQSKRSTTNRF